MQFYSKEIRLAFFSLVASLFLLSWMNTSFSQEPLPEISDEDLELLEQFLEYADKFFEEENFEEAILFYDRALGIDSNDFHALFGMAFTLDSISKYGEAISYYDKILAINPSDTDALDGKELALESLLKEEESLSEISEEDLELIEQYLELAKGYFEENEFETAIGFYDLVLEIDPSDIEALNGKELALESLTNEEEPFLEISDEDLDLLEEFLEKADDLFKEENYDEAILFYDRVLEIDSFDFDALDGMAQGLNNIGKHEEAITFYDTVLAIDPSYISGLNGKAFAIHNIGKHEEAITYYDAVLAIESTDDDALFGKALVLEALGREDEAITLLEKVIEQAPPVPEFRVPSDGAQNQDDIEEFDQTLFVIIGVFIVILIGIISIDFIARRRKNVSDVLTISVPKQTIFSKPSSDSDSNQKEDDVNPISLDVATSEVNQAMKILSNLREMNMLDDPKTAKQFLLSKGFSKDTVKNAMIGMGIDPSHVADLE